MFTGTGNESPSHRHRKMRKYIYISLIAKIKERRKSHLKNFTSPADEFLLLDWSNNKKRWIIKKQIKM